MRDSHFLATESRLPWRAWVQSGSVLLLLLFSAVGAVGDDQLVETDPLEQSLMEAVEQELAELEKNNPERAEDQDESESKTLLPPLLPETPKEVLPGLIVGQELARTQAVTTAAALSRIEDADFAKQTSEVAKGQILSEAAMQTLRIANQVEAQQKSLPVGIGLSALA